MLEIKGVSKSYGKNQVLKDINLKIEARKIYGLLGKNGVGKTTLLNIISNQTRSSRGEVYFQGESLFENSKALENIAIVKEDGFGIEDIKVGKIFQAAKILYENWDEEYKELLIREFGLNLKENYSNLSRGNKTIVGLITGLASRAPLTLFDEPSLGLDGTYREKFYNLLLKDLEWNPRTVIISTHLIDELANLFEEIIILKDKKVYLKEEVHKLRGKSYFLEGRRDKLSSIIQSKNIIYKEEFGDTIMLGILDSLAYREKTILREAGIKISKMPLERLLVLLAEIEYEKEAK